MCAQCTVCTLQARYQTNPGELFTYLFNNKIGSGLAILFHAWALALEQAGDTRKADAVYAQGIESQAQPVDWLQSQHRYALNSLHTCLTTRSAVVLRFCFMHGRRLWSRPGTHARLMQCMLRALSHKLSLWTDCSPSTGMLLLLSCKCRTTCLLCHSLPSCRTCSIHRLKTC